MHVEDIFPEQGRSLHFKFRLTTIIRVGDKDIFLSSGRKWRLAEEKDTRLIVNYSSTTVQSSGPSFPWTGVEQRDRASC
jgi:hypothetical protein